MSLEPGCSIEGNIRKSPAANPQKAGSRTHTQVQFLPVLGQAHQNPKLCWDSPWAGSGGSVPGQQQDLNIPCAFIPEGTSPWCHTSAGVTIPFQGHWFSHQTQAASTAAQPCAHREYKWWIKLPRLPVLSLGDHGKPATSPKWNCWLLSVPRASQLKHHVWSATLLRNVNK